MKLTGIAVREMKRRPGRTLLTVLGIAIGVAAIVSVETTVDTTQRAHRTMFEAIAGKADLEIVADGMGAIPVGLAHGFENTEGIAHVLPVIQGFSVLLSGDKRLPVALLGIDRERDRAVRSYEVVAGHFISEGEQVLLEESFAAGLGVEPAATVRILSTGGLRELAVAGLLAARGPAAANGGAVLITSVDTAQKILGLRDQVNAVHLVLADGADLIAVQRAVESQLPTGFLVQRPQTRAALGRDAMASTEQVLALISMFSLVAGAFVVLNAFLMNLAERRHSLAIMRSLGTTRRQIRSLLLRNALILGVAGTMLGIILGVAFSALTTLALAKTMSLNLPGIELSFGAILRGAVVGPVVALAASFVPAGRASRRPLLDDLMGRGAPEHHMAHPAVFVLGLVSLAGSLTILLTLMYGDLDKQLVPQLITPGGVLFLVGWVLIMPSLSPALGRFVYRLVRPLLGMEGMIAFRQLDRHRTRTSLTVGVLFIAVVVTIGLGNAVVTSADDIQDWYERTITADYFIRGVMTDSATITSSQIPDDLQGEIAAIDGVATVLPLRFIQTRVGELPVVVIARPYLRGRVPELDLIDEDPVAVQRRLESGEVAVGSVLADRLGVATGDTVALETRHGPTELRVAAVFTAYTAGGVVVAMDWDAAQGLFESQGVDAWLVDANENPPASLPANLASLAERHGLMFQTREELAIYIDDLVQGVNGLLWALLAVMFVVASMGTVNSLSMNVLDQIREIGVLRAVALKRGQLRHMILTQGLLMAATGALPGLVVGAGLTYLFAVSTRAISGYEMAYEMHPSVIIGTLVLMTVMTVLASVLPARKAASLSIVEAIHYQ